jgi:ferredoxin--NADP+ reductase
LTELTERHFECEKTPMLTPATVSEEDALGLRRDHYNAELVQVILIHEDLSIFRVRPDTGVMPFLPGQYTVLGLGYWESRFEDIPDDDHDESEIRKLCKRAYSISCPLLDGEGRLLPVEQSPFLKFYIVLIREALPNVPALTPRLFALRAGDRLFVGPKVTGHYTLAGVRPDDDCVFVATGTGEAPHNAMIARLLDTGHRGRIVSVVCARNRRDFGYLQQHRALEELYGNYRHLSLTTREPENLDGSLPGFTGKRYLQEYLESGDFERDAGLALDPKRVHVFLCGNPAMIGTPRRGANGAWQYPQPKGIVEVLEQRGFQADLPRQPGNVHFEKYW